MTQAFKVITQRQLTLFPLYLLLKIYYYCFCLLEFFNSLEYLFQWDKQETLDFNQSECAYWKTKTIQNHLNFTDFDDIAAYCIPHRQRAFPKKVRADYKQLA